MPVDDDDFDCAPDETPEAMARRVDMLIERSDALGGPTAAETVEQVLAVIERTYNELAELVGDSGDKIVAAELLLSRRAGECEPGGREAGKRYAASTLLSSMLVGVRFRGLPPLPDSGDGDSASG